MAASQAGLFTIQEFTDASVVLVGGRLYTYTFGTTTFKTAYTDAAGTIPQTYTADGLGGQYIALNARGELPAPLYLTTGSYDITLKRADNSTVWTRRADPINDNTALSDGTSAATGAGMVAFTYALGYAAGTIGKWLKDLATSAGAAFIGFDSTVAYVAGTLGAILQDGPVEVIRFLTQNERAQVKAGGNSIDLTAKVAAAKFWAGQRPLVISAGKWSVTAWPSLVGNTGGIIGEGAGNTTIEIRASVSRAIDLNETTDSAVTGARAGVLRGFTLDGNGVALGIGIDMRYRHQFEVRDVVVRGFTGAGGVGWKQKDCYECTGTQVRTAANGTGHWLVGSNHSSVYTKCTSDTNSVCNLLIQTAGTIADGNKALNFVGCTYQTGPAAVGGNIDNMSDTTLFTGCYLGENNGAGCATILNRVGLVTLVGGDFFYGNTATSWGVTPLGGKVWIEHSNINGQSSSGISVMCGGGNGGTFAWSNCKFNGIVSGTPFWVGDVVDYGPQGTVYAERLGKNWAGEGNAITFSSAVSGNKQTWTVLTAPGPTPLLGAGCSLTNMTKWRDGENLFILFVYESSKPVTVRTSAGAFGAPVLTLASALPATGAAPSGTPNTNPSFGVIATNTAATLVEAIQSASAVTDFLSIYEFVLEDSRKLNKGGGQVGNMFKG